MEPQKKIRGKLGPEAKIQKAIITMLRGHEWFVRVMHGNLYQTGFPDLFASHRSYGIRLIEVKNPVKYSFTPAQLETFPMFAANGAGIWILVAATEDEYKKLFRPPNWYHYFSLWRNQSGQSK